MLWLYSRRNSLVTLILSNVSNSNCNQMPNFNATNKRLILRCLNNGPDSLNVIKIWDQSIFIINLCLCIMNLKERKINNKKTIELYMRLAYAKWLWANKEVLHRIQLLLFIVWLIKISRKFRRYTWKHKITYSLSSEMK